MRVDTGSAAAPADLLDPITRFKRYLSALRRRWYLVLVPLVVGAALGWFSAPGGISVNKAGVPVATTSYYRASHVLVEATSSASPNTSPNTASSDQPAQPIDLSQAAYLVNTGEVPAKVAAQLKLPVNDVRGSLLGLPRTSVSSVEVQALATDEKRADTLADSAALNLQAVLTDRAQAAANDAKAKIQAQIDSLNAQIDDLNAKIATNPPNAPQLDAQRSSLTSQYSDLFTQQARLNNQPPVTSGFTTLQNAVAVKISKADYEQDKKVIRDGADYVTGAPVTIPTQTGSGSSTPSVGASRSTRAGLGGLVGLALGLGLVLFSDRLDSRLRRREHVEEVTGLAVVAEIPPLTRTQQKDREVIAHHQHRSPAAEAYRVLRGALLFALSAQRAADIAAANGAVHTDATGTNGQAANGAEPQRATVVMVTSASPAEGKTTTVANLAAVLAEGGLSVLVVNCDFRRPFIQRYLLHAGADRHAAGTELGRMGSILTQTDVEGVRLVTGIGENDPDANPLDVVATQRKIIDTARSRFDVILLDTAPLLTTNDASELLGQCDQILLVVRAGKTRVDAASRVAEVFQRFEAPVVGVVLNDSDETPSAQYYYGYRDDGRRRNTDPATPDAEPGLEPATKG